MVVDIHLTFEELDPHGIGAVDGIALAFMLTVTGLGVSWYIYATLFVPGYK